MLTKVLLSVVFAALLLPVGAPASQLIDRDVSGVALEVDADGVALLTYQKKGKTWRVLAWGAMDALQPEPDARQVEFKLDYSGGWATKGRVTAKGFENVCLPYRGPRLDWLVAACTAPDGTHWALQSWQRALPNYGLKATAERRAWELRLSHFDGEIAQLEIHVNWAYRVFDHLFGSLTYKGEAVHGFGATPQGVPLDTFGRNIYLDTFNSAYGPGWKRENSFLTHNPTGVFCYGLYPHRPRPSGAGERYRATVIGPGVTPDVMWEGTPLTRYDKTEDLVLHRTQRRVYGSDQGCRPV
jgi:hypothetical protein